MKFLHSSDLQLGRPFSHVEDAAAREKLRSARIDVLDTLGCVATENDCSAVLVAGDLFDSTFPDNRTVVSAMVSIRNAGLPFYVIPGNHDNAGSGGFWEQDFFLAEAKKTPNFHLLNQQKPVVLADAVLFPCPLFRKQDSNDVLAWLQRDNLTDGLPADRPWIMLAHGAVHGFDSDASDEDDRGGPSNLLDLTAVDAAIRPDYIALGDWHGQKQVDAHAWYSGTPEPDRFPKGGSYTAGKALVIDIPSRGSVPTVTPVETGRVRWTELPEQFLTGQDSINALEAQTNILLQDRNQADSLKLSLKGSLSFEERKSLDSLLEHLKSATLRFKVSDDIAVHYSQEEISALKDRMNDPLIATVAKELMDDAETGDETAMMALRILYGLVNK